MMDSRTNEAAMEAGYEQVFDDDSGEVLWVKSKVNSQ